MTVLIFLQNSYVGPRADDNSMLDERAFPPPEAQIYIYFFSLVWELCFFAQFVSQWHYVLVYYVQSKLFSYTHAIFAELSLCSRESAKELKNRFSRLYSPHSETEKPRSPVPLAVPLVNAWTQGQCSYRRRSLAVCPELTEERHM